MEDHVALEHMRRAIALAGYGRGRVSPNPPVGCVLARGEERVGEGWHKSFGGPHAEINALKAAGPAARNATAYVTLSPCDHYGKTPPCTEALKAAGVAEVVAAVEDPRKGSGRGLAALQQAGINVRMGVLATQAGWVMRGYLKHTATGLPAVTLKYAMTLDGHIATRAGDSKWISCEASRAYVQTCRAHADAVLVGIGTALADDPRLNVRDPEQAQPLRVILDSAARLSPQAALFSEPGGEVVVITTESAPPSAREALQQAGAEVLSVSSLADGRVDLTAALQALAGKGVREVLCEGGGLLAGALVQKGLVDEILAFVCPKLVGDGNAPVPLAGSGCRLMADALKVEDLSSENLEGDLLVRGRLGDLSWLPS